jgi:intraflagellar transport protein 46
MSEGKKPLSDSEGSSSISDSEDDSLTPSEDDSLTETEESDDEFELNTNATLSNVSLGQKKAVAVNGQHYDEAMELSASEQSVMSEAGPGGSQAAQNTTGGKATTQVSAEHYDEAMELSVSESMMSVDDQSNAIVARKPAPPNDTDSGTVKNKQYDEAISVDSDEDSEEDSLSSSEKEDSTALKSATANASADVNNTRGDSPPSSPPPKNDRNAYKDLVDQKQKDVTEESGGFKDDSPKKFGNSPDNSLSDSSTGTDSDSSDSEPDEPANTNNPKTVTPIHTTPLKDPREGGSPAPAYLQDYSNLNVSSDIKSMFKYIGTFKPIQVEIESKIKCFIPEFMPAIGTLDNFVKVFFPCLKTCSQMQPKQTQLLTAQTHGTVLELQFLSTAKTQMSKRINIRSIERAEKSPAEITRWIKSIADLHRNKPPPTVTYKKPMPDIENLMQIWPEEFEAELKDLKMPPAEIDLTTKEFATISCALVDIPVHAESIVQSLHVLFTLYSEFRSNQHFTNHLTGHETRVHVQACIQAVSH